MNAETGDVLAKAVGFGRTVFSPRGEMVLGADGVYDAKNGSKRFDIPLRGRLADTGGEWRVLAPDGKRVVSSAEGRATLFDVESLGVSAILGPPPLSSFGSARGTSDLAISRDGSLLVHNVESFSAFGIRVAPRFGDSKTIWSMRAELNLSVDVSSDGRWAAVGGDGRGIYDGRDGRAIWPPGPPPAAVVFQDICLQDRLRLAPRGTWIATSDYSGALQIFALQGAPDRDPWSNPVVLPGHCDATAFTRDGRLMATSAAALYETSTTSSNWRQVWSSSLPVEEPSGYSPSDAVFSPDETQLLVSRCSMKTACTTTLLNAATGAVIRSMPELQGPHPSFSPEGSWIVAGAKLLHLPSGEIRSLDADAHAGSPAIFTPEGDIIAGSTNGALTRYCRAH